MGKHPYPRPLCNPFIVSDHAFAALENCNGGAVIECGCGEGGVSAIMADLFRWGFGWKNGFRQYAADTFAGFPYNGNSCEIYKVGQLAPRNNAAEMLASHDITVLCGKIEDTLPARVAAEKFAFAYIDLDLAVPTRFAAEFFFDKILPGGRIGFHDYLHGPNYSLREVAHIVDSVYMYGRLGYREVFRRWQDPAKKRGKRDERFIFFERTGGQCS